MAHAIKNQFNTFAEALVHCWKVIKLQFELFTQPVVKFKYLKVSDNSIREAVGTLETVPAVKGERKAPKFDLLTYFDLDAMAWRSCRIENLLF
jgi:hypothetical protein